MSDTRETVSHTWDIPLRASMDVAVIGGGSAGVAATTAAARNGASTILVERYDFLGDYVLNGQDVLEGRRFDDGIAQCSYPIDIHDPDVDGLENQHQAEKDCTFHIDTTFHQDHVFFAS